MVLTGGGGGLGRAIARAFAGEGARLLLAGNVEHEVTEAATELGRLGASAVGMVADVTRAADMEAMATRAVREWGALDVLVTAAGVSGTGLILDQPEADWLAVIDINLSGTYRAIRAVLPQMIRQKQGRIVTISSVYGRAGGSGFISAYAASKHGVIGLTRAVAGEVASQGYPGITANAICPGYVRAGMGLAGQKAKAPEGGTREVPGEEIFDRFMKRRVPQRRMLEADEIGAAAVFLSLPESRGITGQALNVDGGLLMA